MVQTPPRPLLPAPVARVLGWSLIYFLLVAGVFTFPNAPTPGLDPSWRMAFGYYFQHDLQFGRDVVFNYGPLGFLMGNTFSGLQFWPLIAGQLVIALISATVITREGARMVGSQRLAFFVFILLFAMLYQDAMHMIVLAILGFELLRLMDEPHRGKMVLIGTVLAFYAQIKFTDCLLADFIVLVVGSYGFWRRHPRAVATLGLTYVGAYVLFWIGCGQHLSNLPAYYHSSWQISDGYQWSMGIPAPAGALWKGLVVLLVVATYAILPLFRSTDKPRAWANGLLLGAFIYLNWKHGFVRADGHMIGFFFCAMLPLIAYPVLLGDADWHRQTHRWVFALTTLLCVFALEDALDGTVRLSLGWMEDKIWRNVSQVIDWKGTRQRYRDQLAVARAGADLHQTRELMGKATVDVLGCEQSVAIFNQFNYQPRPVIQGYSTFTPELTRLNGDYLASDRAPEFLLSRIETIDNRLLSLDDAEVMRLLPYRYEYLTTEKSFLVWRRLPGPFDASRLKPKLIRNETAEVNRPLKIDDLAGTPLWAKIELEPSLLGRMRNFFYKPAQVWLSIADTVGGSRDFLMPALQARGGFILTPIISDTVDYMYYASAKPQRWAKSITVKIADDDTKYFAGTARVELSALPPLASNGEKYFPKDIERLFPMFRTLPIAYEAHTPISATRIDDRDVVIAHAPSLLTFDLPAGAKYISGMFGFMPATYTGDGRTNGARFIIYWSNGTDRRDLYQKFLNPVSVKEDRGLQAFKVDLSSVSGGLLFLEIHPGPYNDLGWDWTGWTDIYISR